MKCQVLTTQDSDEWHHLLERFPEADAYFLPEYHQAYELNGEGEARAFVASEGEEMLFYPFLVRSIDRVGGELVSEPCCDIETVYGYSGPLVKTTSPEFPERAWKSFSDWCRNEHIVAEFIRFHPLLENHCLVDGSCRVVRDRDTVAVRIDGTESELWAAYPSVQRNMVRKALAKGLICQEVGAKDGLEVFKHLYKSTMERVGAEKRYFFSDDYFESLLSGLGNTVRLFTVQDGDHPVSAALFLQHGDRVHYHLAGSDERYSSAAPSNLLLHTVAQWGQRNGLRWLHLGGGRTADSDDGLFRFKSRISRLRLPFYVGMRIHDHQMYQNLCRMWMQQSCLSTPPSYFLLYRLEQRETDCSG